MNDMRPDILSLGFVHFQETCQSISSIAFSDSRKKVFCNELKKISDIFLTYNVAGFSSIDLMEKKSELDFLWQWALALDNRNGYTLSHEMRATMDNLCSAWVKNSDKFIFAATDGDFAMNPYVSSWDVLMDAFEKCYGLRFSHQLVTFTVPKHLFDDYLFSSIIYHEMGHFVDNYYNVSDEVVRRLKNRLSCGAEEKRIRTEFFPEIQSVYDAAKGVYTDEKVRDQILFSYVGEYISDLFGAQYLGLHIINFLEFNRHGTYHICTKTHPSPKARASLVSAFLSGDVSNFLLSDILDSFKATGLDLKNRYVRPADAANLEKGQPITITNDEELHSLFQLGWEVYFKGAKAMDAACGKTIGATNQYDFYQKVKGAMKQSIRSYLG